MNKEFTVLPSLSGLYGLTDVDMAHLDAEKKALLECISDEFKGRIVFENTEQMSNAFQVVVQYTSDTISDESRQAVRNKFDHLTMQTKDNRDYYFLRFHKASECGLNIKVMHNRTCCTLLVENTIKMMLIGGLAALVYWSIGNMTFV